jgi:hypothetical protein
MELYVESPWPSRHGSIRYCRERAVTPTAKFGHPSVGPTYRGRNTLFSAFLFDAK